MQGRKIKDLFSRDRKTLYIILSIVLISIFSLTIVYAALSVTLNITGSTEVTASNWNIHLANPEVKSGSVNSNVPTISGNNLSFSANLVMPGDYYEFSVDVVNGGTIDGMIELFTSTIKVGDGPEEVVSSSTIPSYLSYSVKYNDNSDIQVNRSLNASTSRTIIVHVELKDDITAEELAELDGTTISLKLGMSYKQKDSTAID